MGHIFGIIIDELRYSRGAFIQFQTVSRCKGNTTITIMDALPYEFSPAGTMVDGSPRAASPDCAQGPAMVGPT